MPDPLALAITTGEPAGIGPDITIGALLQLAGSNGNRNGHYRFHVLGDARLLASRAAALGVGHAWTRQIGEGGVVVEDVRSACRASRAGSTPATAATCWRCSTPPSTACRPANTRR